MKNRGKKKRGGLIALILKVIIISIIIFVLLASGIIMFKANRYPDKIPDVFGYKPMIVLSGSMETFIYTGDLVFVKVVDANSLKINDIIAFRNEENTVTTHRIIDIINKNENISFRTKGDNNNAEDANLVETEDIEGIYVFKISGLGDILMILKEPKSLAVILLAILVVGLLWINILDKIENKNSKIEDEKYRKEFEEFKKQQELKKRE